MDIAKKIKIINDFEWYYKNGYITTRDGNACFQKEDGNFMITASGVPKHLLDRESFVTMDAEGLLISQEHPSSEPSIEADAHIIALKKSNKKASVHVHSPNTVALFALTEDEEDLWQLEEYIKNNWPEFFRYTRLGQTVFYADPGSSDLHNAIGDCFTGNTIPDIIVLERHGVLAVGDTLEQCREHIERLEHVCLMILKILMANGRRSVWK